jgi:hypothetical protein
MPEQWTLRYFHYVTKVAALKTPGQQFLGKSELVICTRKIIKFTKKLAYAECHPELSSANTGFKVKDLSAYHEGLSVEASGLEKGGNNPVEQDGKYIINLYLIIKLIFN